MLPFLDLVRGTGELRQEIDGALARVLDSGQYVGGNEVAGFEQEFAAYGGARYAIGTGNGLDALTLMLRAYGIGAGDEVIVPSNTYIATWLALSAVSASIVPVEPDPGTYNIDPNRVVSAITPRTRALLAVHLYGRRANMEALTEIANSRGLHLFVDAAQAHGIPHSGDASAFSFYPTKNLGALGDAGAVLTNDLRVARRIRMLANYGSREKYFHEICGVNSRLDPLQAAVLRVKLKHLNEWNLRRCKIAQRYREELRDTPLLKLPDANESMSENVWHIYPVFHPQREALARTLAALGVNTMIHYPQPPHLSNAYRDTGFRMGDYPIAEYLADHELSLPLHPHLEDHEVTQVIDAVQEAGALMTAAHKQSTSAVLQA